MLAVPDKLFPAEILSGLQTKYIGKKIEYRARTASTMDVAWQLGAEGAPQGTLVVAESQTKGRGRFQRQWSSPAQGGVYLSLLLRPRIPPQEASVLTLLAAVAVCEAVGELLGLSLQIKWPNDIFYGDKKIGGILTELDAEMDEIHFVVVGMGLNVSTSARDLPDHAQSLMQVVGKEVSRLQVVQQLLVAFERWYDLFCRKGSAPVLEAWRTYTTTLGKRIVIQYHNRKSEALALDIDTDGALIIRTDAGLRQRVTAGDITHCC